MEGARDRVGGGADGERCGGARSHRVSVRRRMPLHLLLLRLVALDHRRTDATSRRRRSEEHTSELQSRPHLVCRLLLEKKKTHDTVHHWSMRCAETHTL